MRNEHLQGITAMLLSVGGFALMDAGLKQLSEHYSPMQVSCLRGAASLPFILLPIAVRNDWRSLKPVRWGLHLARGVLAVIMMATFVYAVSVLSLASTYAIVLCAPLFVTALSVPLLGERVGWRRWAVILFGFAGVLMMLRPSGENLVTLGGLAAVVCALAYALSAIAIRVLARTDTTASTVVWLMVMLTVFAGVLAWPDWRPVRSADLWWIAWIGLTGAVAQLFVTTAFRKAPPSVVAPFEYSALLWGVALDWVIWSTLPDARTLFGGSVVIASGLYIIFRERGLLRREPRLAPSADGGTGP
jgi:drug/metabolite transporter (DMT)-like permease